LKKTDEEGMGIKYLAYLLLFLFMLTGCSDEPGLKEEDMTDFNRLTWIKGIWEGRQGDAYIYESWRSKSFRTLEGISYTTINNQRVYSQNMRIEQSSNKITLNIRIDEGETETVLDMTEIDDNRVVFNISSGSYPEQVIYTRESDGNMVVQISGDQVTDTGSQEFRYKRSGDT
jgi:hypothetical protein